MTAKKKAATPKKKAAIPKPRFRQGQRVIYDGWDQLGEVHNTLAVIECVEEADDILSDDDDGRLYSRKSPKKLAWWYHIRLVGDKYARSACEDELTLPPLPKFEPGNIVDFNIVNPKYGGESPRVEGSGIVVEVHEDGESHTYSYGVWVKTGELAASDVKTPFRIPEECLSLAKKGKKGKSA